MVLAWDLPYAIILRLAILSAKGKMGYLQNGKAKRKTEGY
jgi:hypothetical protein